MNNSADLGGCLNLVRHLASVDYIPLDLQNSLYPTQPHSIIINIRPDIAFVADELNSGKATQANQTLSWMIPHHLSWKSSGIFLFHFLLTLFPFCFVWHHTWVYTPGRLSIKIVRLYAIFSSTCSRQFSSHSKSCDKSPLIKLARSRNCQDFRPIFSQWVTSASSLRDI